jgi:hypothetical protein
LQSQKQKVQVETIRLKPTDQSNRAAAKVRSVEAGDFVRRKAAGSAGILLSIHQLLLSSFSYRLRVCCLPPQLWLQGVLLSWRVRLPAKQLRPLQQPHQIDHHTAALLTSPSPAPTGTTLADAAMQQLVAGGLSVCFANPGTTEIFLVAALEKQKPGLRSILCLHEAVCTGACDGYARMAGSPAAALLHLGPGLGNGLCNLHNAHRARSPVLVLVGEHATWHKAADPPLAQNIQVKVKGHTCTAAAVSSQAIGISWVAKQAIHFCPCHTGPGSNSVKGGADSQQP